MRLVDADSLDKRIYNDIPISVFGSIKKMAAVREIIAEQPTVDAVDVVRCADCKWCRWIYRKEKSLDTLVCDRFDRDVKYDWFCADGEKHDK